MSDEKITPEYLEATGNKLLALAAEIASWQVPNPSQAAEIAHVAQSQREQAEKLLAAAAAVRAGHAVIID